MNYKKKLNKKNIYKHKELKIHYNAKAYIEAGQCI